MIRNITILVTIILSLTPATFDAQTTFTVPGSHNYTVPTGITLLRVEAWGGGGGGSTNLNSNRRGGGGGGGAYASTIVTVVSGGIYSLVVGAGGAGSSSGGASSFNTNQVIAVGGSGATGNTSTAGAGGLAASSTGTIRFTGGNGANGDGNNGNFTGGGGGGAGSNGNGGNAATSTAGTGTTMHGGNGGAGRTSGGSGNPGSNFGGGGSGAWGTNFGGSGAGGQVIITPITTVQVNASLGVALQFYADVRTAFEAINSGVHRGSITIRINDNTTETAIATLQASGVGGANYTDVTLFPTVSGLTIGGALNAPLIQFNGADAVMIDGRVNQAGIANLIISNTQTGTLANTIEWINSAQNNTIQYVHLRGAGTGSTVGLLHFGTSLSGTGNDGNVVQYSHITGISASNRPVNTVYSAGTATRENSDNVIRNNQFSNFLHPSIASNAILISSNSTSFTINGNSFFETTAQAPTASVEYAVVRINNPSGVNFTINDNFIGGNAAGATGVWTKTNVQNNLFNAIHLQVGNNGNSVQGNTIRNFNYANSGAADWFGIVVQAGAVFIGTVTGNTIGASSGVGSIQFTAGATNASFYAIFVSSTQTVNVYNNWIGSITTNTATATLACHFYGIHKSAVAGIVNIRNNVIGSATTGNSIQTASLATANSQILYGIYTLGSGVNTIVENRVANLTNATSETTLASRVRGIFANAGSNTIRSNAVYALRTRGLSNQANYAGASLVGISLISTGLGNPQTISDNTVHTLENNTTNTTLRFEMYGIYFDGPTNVNGIISRNFVHTFIIPTGSSIGHYLHGISLFGGSFTATNNIVFLGNNIDVGCSLWGLWTNSVNEVRIYHNTIYITGVALTGTSNSFALRVLSCPATIDVRNNILWNGRVNSLTGVSHFSIFLNCLTNATVNFNNYQFAQEFGRVGVTAYNSLAAWQTGTSLDAQSLNVDPLLVNLGGVLPVDYQSGIQLQGTHIAGHSTDFDGVTRVRLPWGHGSFSLCLWKFGTGLCFVKLI